MVPGGNVAGANVELLGLDEQPLSLLDAASEDQPPFRVPADQRGFFQITAVPPSDYLVVAITKDLSSDRIPIRIGDDAIETKLDAPVIMSQPVPLDVYIQPPEHPAGKPWRVTLLTGAQKSERPMAWKSPVSEQGHWRAEALRVGHYVLRVGGSLGGSWYTTDFEIAPGDSSPVRLDVDVPVLAIRGLVHVGDQPLEAKLLFRQPEGESQAAFESNEDGEFSGFIRQRPDDSAEWQVRVESDKPRMHRTLERVDVRPSADGEAWVDLSLPDTEIRGRLVQPDGSLPWPRPAIVTAQSLGESGSLAQAAVSSEDAGEFRISGLEPGAYWLAAESGESESNRTNVTVEEDTTPPWVTLVMNDSQALRGQVVSGAGRPVPGAQVVVRPLERAGSFFRPKRTDANGEFAIQLPLDTRVLNVSVAAPGFAFWMGRVHVLQDERITIRVDRSGGTLRLALEESPTAVFVAANGAYVSLAYLLQAAGHLSGSELVLPEMSPGRYTVCRIPDARGLQAASRGVLPQERCESGVVEVATELLLTVPSGGT